MCGSVGGSNVLGEGVGGLAGRLSTLADSLEIRL